MQIAFGQALQATVDRPQQKWNELDKSIAIAVLLFACFSIVAIGVILLSVEEMQPPSSIKIETFKLSANDDWHERLHACSRWEDLTDYGDKGLIVGSVVGVGPVYVRKNPLDLPLSEYSPSLRTLLCRSVIPFGSFEMYGSTIGDIVDVSGCTQKCLRQSQSPDNADIYVEHTSSDLRHWGVVYESILTSAYQQMKERVGATTGPSMIGMAVMANNLPTDRIFARVMLQFVFGWPLEPERGRFDAHIVYDCEAEFRKFVSGVPDAHHLLNSTGVAYLDDNKIRTVPRESGDVEYVALVYPRCVPGSEGFSTAPQCDYDWTRINDDMYPWARPRFSDPDIHLVLTFMDEYLMQPNLLVGELASQCPQRERSLGPIIQDVYGSDNLWVDASFEGFKQHEAFVVSCETHSYPGVLVHVAHIWPYLSVSLSIVFGLLMQKVYKICYYMRRTGSSLWEAHAHEHHDNSRSGESKDQQDQTDLPQAVRPKVTVEDARVLDQVQQDEVLAMKAKGFECLHML